MPNDVVMTFDPQCRNLETPGACGGPLTGSWCYASYCVDATNLFPDVQANCDAGFAYSQLSGRMLAMVRFDGGVEGHVTRGGRLWITGVMEVADHCLPSGWTCSQLGPALGGFAMDAGCTAGTGTCSCAFGHTRTYDQSSLNEYRVVGNAFLLDAGFMSPPASYEYCSQGGELKVREDGPPSRSRLVH